MIKKIFRYLIVLVIIGLIATLYIYRSDITFQFQKSISTKNYLIKKKFESEFLASCILNENTLEICKDLLESTIAGHNSANKILEILEKRGIQVNTELYQHFKSSLKINDVVKNAKRNQYVINPFELTSMDIAICVDTHFKDLGFKSTKNIILMNIGYGATCYIMTHTNT